MWEMDTQQLKHSVSKNIGGIIEIFSLPTLATYLVKNKVEKWDVEVVEDTTQIN